MNLMLDMNKKLGKFISGKYKRGSFGGSGSDGGGGSSDNSKLEPNNSVPMVNVTRQ